ncbi:PEP-CTERM sorting domain-containing protein [Nitrosomonas sp. sh817]|uniref:PEP-CTERM sorting domain-containing protein n=1 Tax=Nitrosomonas sp. sh817 TaxID=3070658 RepID=UPI0027DB2DD9|nr:PEP-CTERM sorting domain-containing protein [Nitrosomonas sp. sh817]WMJ08177.1 PEP-CTERM sorting domain-containing protein [Nitrosomonas sp. sh817]
MKLKTILLSLGLLSATGAVAAPTYTFTLDAAGPVQTAFGVDYGLIGTPASLAVAGNIDEMDVNPAPSILQSVTSGISGSINVGGEELSVTSMTIEAYDNVTLTGAPSSDDMLRVVLGIDPADTIDGKDGWSAVFMRKGSGDTFSLDGDTSASELTQIVTGIYSTGSSLFMLSGTPGVDYGVVNVRPNEFSMTAESVTSPVPEPSQVALFGAGLAALWGASAFGRLRRKDAVVSCSCGQSESFS